jgi:membrane protein implicated in regulation of membrane protease activity
MLELFESSLLTVGVISSIVILVLFIATLLGVDSLDGVEADFDGDFDGGISQYLSLRNLASFLSMFSWTYLGLKEADIFGTFGVFIISLVVGIGFVLLLNSLFIFLYKQQQNNILSETDIVGKDGTVITSIEPNKSGEIEIYSPKFMALEAYSNDTLKKGDKVRILEYGAGTCRVEKI